MVMVLPKFEDKYTFYGLEKNEMTGRGSESVAGKDGGRL